jgi:hypothetical protein
MSYEAEMFQLFTDQCREAEQERGRWGRLSLWLRTLADFGVTVVREHLSDSNARLGLLEVAPNQPLPWKGVLLVLIPGSIFFISQIEQVTSNNDWFFLAFYRAGYFLILPVLLTWALTRRFPVWGLVPLGLLYETLWNYFQRFDLLSLHFRFINRWFYDGSIIRFGIRIDVYTLKYLLGVTLALTLAGILIWHSAHRGQIPRSAWKWLGVWGLLIVLQMGEDIRNFAAWINNYDASSSSLPLNVLLPDLKGQLLYNLSWDLYQALPFLLLVFIGLLFASKYGGFSFLLLLGYLLPTIVFGRYGEWNDPVNFYLVTLAVLLYRFVVALVAPTWLVRAASVPGRQRAAIIPVVVAVLCQLSLTVVVSMAWSNQIGYPWAAFEFVMEIWDQVIIAVALVLAVTLYLPKEQDRVVLPPPTLAAATE